MLHNGMPFCILWVDVVNAMFYCTQAMSRSNWEAETVQQYCLQLQLQEHQGDLVKAPTAAWVPAAWSGLPPPFKKG